MKRKVVETSQEANTLKTQDSKQRDWDKIIAALQVLGMANYEDIAEYNNWTDKNVCSRRLLELCPATDTNPKGKGLIYNTGLKNLTKRNRKAFMYAIKSDGSKESEVEFNYRKDKVTSTDYANKIIETANGQGYIQPELF